MTLIIAVWSVLALVTLILTILGFGAYERGRKEEEAFLAERRKTRR